MKVTSYVLLALVSLFSLSALGQVNVKDSLQTILQNDTIDTEIRFKNSYNLLFYNSSPEEAEALGMNIVYPFVKKTWKNQSEQLSHLARLQLLVSLCYRERGGADRDEKERLFLEKAVETAVKSGDNAICARCYTAFAYMELKRGEVKQAHEYLYIAIYYYDKMEAYVKASEQLYVIFGGFFDIKDLDGMKRVLQQMKEYLEKDTSKQSLYQYNVVKKSYFELVLEKDSSGTVNYPLVDSAMTYIKRNINLVENFLGELDPNWMHGWAYYYMAKAYNDYYPAQTDSIYHYLDKALDMLNRERTSRMNESNSVMELKIYIDQIRAQALLREGKTQESYKAMDESLLLLDELKNYKNLDEKRYIAYQFMANYYEKTNRPGEALKYQKLLRKSEAQRYDREKIQAINEMSAKYEVEKKEAQIVWLKEKNKTAHQILMLIIGLLVVLLAVFVLIIYFFRLRKKNLEQKVYESALLAELQQTELERNAEEKKLLQQQYDNLETLAGQSARQAEELGTELQHIKQQIEQKPTQALIDKTIQSISKSLIVKDNRTQYIERLQTLDADLLEQGYLAADEKITNMDMKYIICFAVDMDVKDISLIYNVEPASVRTVRYRIKKKFGAKNTFKFLL